MLMIRMELDLYNLLNLIERVAIECYPVPNSFNIGKLIKRSLITSKGGTILAVNMIKPFHLET